MRRNQTNPFAHLPDDELLLFVERELSTRRAIDARDHLALCPACRARIAQLENAMADFASLHEERLSRESPLLSRSRSSFRARLAETSAGSRRADFSFAANFSLASRQLACACLALLLLAGSGWALRDLAQWHNASDQLAIALPSKKLTPGATRPVAVADLCQSQGAGNGVAVDASLEQRVFTEYGLPESARKAYELDYLITPELGGATDIRNLWPEPYSSTSWNAHVKDDLENHLHELVCQGKLPLATAQNEIATDWIAAYKKHFHTDSPLSNAAALNINTSIDAVEVVRPPFRRESPAL